MFVLLIAWCLKIQLLKIPQPRNSTTQRKYPPFKIIPRFTHWSLKLFLQLYPELMMQHSHSWVPIFSLVSCFSWYFASFLHDFFFSYLVILVIINLSLSVLLSTSITLYLLFNQHFTISSIDCKILRWKFLTTKVEVLNDVSIFEGNY